MLTRAMMSKTLALALLAAPAFAGSHSGSGYLARDLMSPCQEADNDARWGEAAETECEQYIVGFVEALKVSGAAGAGTDICPPELNMADEVRWAFMRWVHGDFTARRAMSASDALFATLKDTFPCAN